MSKILFYIEPFPIRNSMLHFKDIIKYFYPAITSNETDNEIFIYSNYETLSQMDKELVGINKYFLVPSSKENEFFEQCLIDWDPDGINKWKQLMSKSELSDDFVSILNSVYKRNPFDYIVCWGTNYAVKDFASQNNVGFINMELGCSRTPFLNSFCADPMGVNGSASICNASIEDFQSLNGSDAFDDLILGTNNSLGYESCFSYINSKNIFNNIDEDSKICFLPLQLYDDANLLMYSKYNTILEMLEEVLPKLKEANIICIIKEHPSSSARNGSNLANLKAKVYALGFDNVNWITSDDKISNTQLFKLSDFVMTINSSVGFESLYFEKPVVVLGDAVYKIKNVFPSLEEILLNKFDYEKYKIEISKIREFFLNYYLINDKEINDSNFIFNYIKFVGDLSKNTQNISQIIKSYITYRMEQTAKK